MAEPTLPAPAAHEVRFFPADLVTRLTSFDAIFPRAAPVEIDAGCGEGTFLLEMARRFPERNFLALERQLGRVEKVCRQAGARALTNVRVLLLETAYTIEYLLPPASVSVFHLNFPDPWPKRRHWPNRIVQTEFVRHVARLLVPGGEMSIKTDNADYFAWILRVVGKQSLLAQVPWEPAPDELLTDFERVFLADGRAIQRLRLRKL